MGVKQILMKLLSYCPIGQTNLGIITGMLQAIFENPSILIRLLFYAPYTPSIKFTSSNEDQQQNDRQENESIAILQEVLINDVKHSILLRSYHKSSPVILVLHGGPGATDLPFHNSYGQYLEKSYLVIHYDQRSSCKTGAKYLHNKLFFQSLTVEQHVNDVIGIVEWIQNNFNQAKNGIYLIGGSWGSMLALETVKKRPDLFLKVLLRGVVTNSKKSEANGNEFIINRMKYFHYPPEEINYVSTELTSPYQSITHLLKQREYLTSLGGMDYHSFQAPTPLPRWYLSHSMAYSMFKCSEISLFELITMKPCMIRTLEVMWREVEDADMLTRLKKEINIPVAVVHGRHDHCTSHLLVEEFLSQLSAPEKYLIWFRQSG